MTRVTLIFEDKRRSATSSSTHHYFLPFPDLAVLRLSLKIFLETNFNVNEAVGLKVLFTRMIKSLYTPQATRAINSPSYIELSHDAYVQGTHLGEHGSEDGKVDKIRSC